jgi:hypothetical protein
MCAPSVVAEDWITKGFHFTVGGTELALRPDHLGRVAIQRVFASTKRTALEIAVRRALDECLPDREVRHRWERQIDNAMLLMAGHHGVLAELANGRLAEFNFLKIALRRY